MNTSVFSSYKGYFHDDIAIDMSLKIVSALSMFICTIFFLAWWITYKNYRLPKLSSKNYWLENTSSLYCFKIIRYFAIDKSDVPFKSHFTAIKINSNFCTVIGDRKLHEKFHYHLFLNSQETAASNNLSLNWFGLLFNKCFNEQHGPLRLILKQCFDTIPPALILHSLESSDLIIEKILSNSSLNVPDELAWFSISEFYFFETSPNLEDTKLKTEFLKSLRYLVEDAFILHSAGKIICDGNVVKDDQFLKSVVTTLGPFVTAVGNNRTEKWTPDLDTNFSERIFLARKETSVELGDSSLEHAGLSVMHLILDSLVVLHYSISRSLNVLLYALSQRSDWLLLLKSDSHGVDCIHSKSKDFKDKSKIPDECLSVENLECFPWSKALIFESLRVSCAGWPFGSFRHVLRDGSFGEYHFREDDLVLFNEPAFFSQAWVHSNDGDRCIHFKPIRHLIESNLNSNINYQVHISNYWARVMLDSDCLGVTRKFMRWLLMFITLKLFVNNNLDVKVKISTGKTSKLLSSNICESLVIPDILPEIQLIELV